MRESSLDPDLKVARSRVVYAQDGHMLHASHYDDQRSLRWWDYCLAEHGGLGGITDRQGQLVSLRLRNGSIYFN